MNPVRILPRTKAESAASASLPANSVGIVGIEADRKAAMLAYIRAGVRDVVIAEAFGISPSRVSFVAREAGISRGGKRDVRERIRRRCDIIHEGHATACWIWRGHKTKGYGRIRVDGVTKAAHRVSYEALKGPIPEGLQLDHLCRNPGCVNPDHLEPVTALVNVRRGARTTVPVLTFSSDHCPSGHEFTPANTYIQRGGGRVCRRCRATAAAKPKPRLMIVFGNAYFDWLAAQNRRRWQREG